MKTEVIRQIL